MSALRVDDTRHRAWCKVIAMTGERCSGDDLCERPAGDGELDEAGMAVVDEDGDGGVGNEGGGV